MRAWAGLNQYRKVATSTRSNEITTISGVGEGEPGGSQGTPVDPPLFRTLHTCTRKEHIFFFVICNFSIIFIISQPTLYDGSF